MDEANAGDELYPIAVLIDELKVRGGRARPRYTKYSLLIYVHLAAR